jgi:hypothetical protein
MGLEVGGYHDLPDWPKMGPSLLISTALILAIRTARWPVQFDAALSETDLEKEIDFASYLARKVLMRLIAKEEAIFPGKKEPWYRADDEDLPK